MVAAPEFSLVSLDGAVMRLERLRARGPVVVVFVNEECPTSALTLRRLASLAGRLDRDGVALVCVCQDPPEVAARVARRTHAGFMFLSEPPPYEVSRAYGLRSVPTSVLVGTDGLVLDIVVGWDRAGLERLLGTAAAQVGAEPVGLPPEEPQHKPGCAAKNTVDPELLRAESLGLDELEDMFERGWTDGLPVVPPTRERVEAMLGGRDPAESLGLVPPGMGEATLERVAACAVLAGCLPTYFPVVLAVVEAALEPAFNLHGQTVTTHSCSPVVIVNGPVRERVGVNGGMGALGPGWRANMTIGRALRLLVTLTGGGAPGRLARSTLGQPGRIGLCFAENEEASPWVPLHVERGYGREASTVTLFAGDGPVCVSDHQSRAPEELAWSLASAAAALWNPGFWPLAAETLFVLGQEHAASFAGAGWSKDDVRGALFAAACRPARELRRGELTMVARTAQPDAPVHKWSSPEEIVIVVAGGEAGRFSSIIGPWVGFGLGSEIVTKEVRWST